VISFADLRKLRRQSPANRYLLLEAGLSLGIVRAAILVLPFAWVARRLALETGNGATSPMADDPAARAAALRIGRAIRIAAHRTPWESKCLAQALAAALMLRSRKIPFVLTLGVAKTPNPSPGIDAHAWLFSGDILLTGAGYERYSAIAQFTSAMGRRA
jgi:Transglutaminase-like superfamily